jgi:signal transduction histidine kinase
MTMHEATMREQELLERLRAAEQAVARLERENLEKTEFLARVSHELRTPLTAVLGYTELLLEGVPQRLHPSSAEHVHRIRASGWHQLNLVNELLRYARLQTAQEEVILEDMQLRFMIADVVALVTPSIAKKGLRLDVVHSPRDVSLRTQPTRVRQILLNLLWNAAKFTASGCISVRTEVTDSALQVAVTDSGPGIPRENIERIFDPFWQAKTSSGPSDGVGLGLTLSRSMARSLGGDLVVESTPGNGSTFTLLLPLNTLPAVTERKQESAT